LLSFKITSWLVLNYIQKHHNKAASLMHEAALERKKYPNWLQINSNSALNNHQYNAFYNNIKTLVSNASLNNTQTVLVQMPYPEENEYYMGIYGRAIKSHNKFLEEISLEFKIPIVKIQEVKIPNSNFTDLIHVDSIGNYIKGKAIAKKIVEEVSF
jgi:hypothetical protein